MRRSKPKEQPFYVKRIRLKRSIIKTHEILDTIYINDSKKYNTITQSVHHQIDDNDHNKKITVDHISVNESDLFSNKGNRFNLKQMKNLLKICQSRKEKETEYQMNVVGLQVRRICAVPEHWKNSDVFEERYSRNKSSQQAKNKKLNLLILSEELSNDMTDNKKCDNDKLPVSRSNIKEDQFDKLEQKCFTSCSPSRKNKSYLYERMAGSQKKMRDKSNQIYQRRIQSYTYFLWKLMLAHNVYLNMDLAGDFNPQHKLKAFVGYGNNCNMIKGLLKRRFWWTISEENSEECSFVWTQIKVAKIYERQQPAKPSIVKYFRKNTTRQRISLIHTSHSSTKQKAGQNLTQSIRKTDREVFSKQYEYNLKIWSKQDHLLLKDYFLKLQFASKLKKQTYGTIRDVSFLTRTADIKSGYKQLQMIKNTLFPENNSDQIEDNYYRARPLVHNHLQNNFFLGNKKALFYNLQDYYRRIGDDVFNYVPLTFHIKKGLKDAEYKRFLQFYQNRAKLIKKQQQNQEIQNKKKTRNIWIVKPGQNTNQGRGITVIDEVYELNNIIKTSQQKNKTISAKIHQENQQRTFIVQLYLDRPFLYNDRKFDIRHYMLITNLYGVTRAYWYEEGYIRTSAYQFNIHIFQPEIHLTNDAIQKNYPQYGRYEPANKISYAQFQNYLNSNEKKHNFKEQVLPKMKKMGRDAVRSVFTKISPKNLLNNFEIFGLDFMIDSHFRPWLIEINTNPCLECICPLLDRIIPYMVEQTLKLSLDIIYPPPSHYPNTSRHLAPLVCMQNFKYDLIFDSHSEGEQLFAIYSVNNRNLMSDIGQIQEDEQFKDNGKEIKLQDFT